MTRLFPTALFAASCLALACGPVLAQTEAESEAAQRIDALVQARQGVLLPLDGALDPELSSVLLLPPPEDSSDEPGLQIEDSEITVMEDGSEPPPPPDEAEVGAAIVAAEEEAVAEDDIAAEAVTEDADTIEETADAITEEAAEDAVAAAEDSEAVAEEVAEGGNLPEIDAMGEIVTAELGNPTTIGPWRLWLASYRTVREAQDGWQQLAKDNRDVLGDLSPVIVMKDLGGDSGTFFRLQAGPLPDESAAKGRCDNLKSRNFYCAILGPQDG